MKIFLCGDVMTGRGVDQALPHPCPPELHEFGMDSALGYLRLAEEANGPIPRPLDPAALWGAARDELNRVQPDARIINLETAITRSEDYEPKGINYRMSPDNAACLTAAGVDCCVLANNHVLDWGRAGLLETLATLRALGIKACGAGRDLEEARAPAILDLGNEGRLMIFALASTTSGTPPSWAAGRGRAGVNLLRPVSEATVTEIAEEVARWRGPNDVVIVSIHWGPNWGYEIPQDQRWLAHCLIDRAGVSIVHGHSAHHAKGIEIYNGRLILYGCGDFLNDYEGISGYEEYRDDLAVMYFATIDSTSADLLALEMVPFQIRRLQLIRASRHDVDWMQRTLDRESEPLGTRVELTQGDRLTARSAAESLGKR